MVVRGRGAISYERGTPVQAALYFRLVSLHSRLESDEEATLGLYHSTIGSRAMMQEKKKKSEP